MTRSHALDASPRTVHLVCCPCCWPMALGIWALSPVAYRPCRGKSLSSQAVGPVPGALDHPTACHPCDPPHLGLAGPLVRLAPRAGHCPTGHVDPLASSGVPTVLALEITTWTSPDPSDLQALIRRMARENPSWGEERIANELLLKLGLCVSPRTVRKYLPKRLDRGRRQRVPSQRWRTFVRNHAQAIVACDFCVVVTATFRLL